MDKWHDFTQVYRCTNLTFLFTDWARLLSSHKGDLCHLSRQRECKYPLSLYNLWILYNLPVSWFHNFPIILHCAKKKKLFARQHACVLYSYILFIRGLPTTYLIGTFFMRPACNLLYNIWSHPNSVCITSQWISCYFVICVFCLELAA